MKVRVKKQDTNRERKKERYERQRDKPLSQLLGLGYFLRLRMAIEEEVISPQRGASPYITGNETSLLNEIKITNLMRKKKMKAK